MSELHAQTPRFAERHLMLHVALGLLSVGDRVAHAATRASPTPPPASSPPHEADLMWLGVLALAVHLEDRLECHTDDLPPMEPSIPPPASDLSR
ncbi:MAG: hypothetical protein KC619_16870 [Myxococcales bacterium]|nr:hypothetical protein [Myxococcales bacterium]